MKPKHYPHVTVAAAIAMLLLPASLLLLSASPEAQSVDEMLASADAEKVTPKVKPPVATVPVATPEQQRRPTTRVAMLQPRRGDHAITFDSPRPAFEQVPTRSVESTGRDTATYATSAMLETGIPEQSTPLAMDSTTEALAAIDEAAEPSENESNEDNTLNEEMAAALAIRSSTDDSHFESTGHLAMTGQVKTPRSTRSKTAQDNRLSGSKSDMPVLLDEDPFASEPKNPIVDILIQQPSERRPVGKVENLVATTQQPGWPIALVRSDLPDDVWWVQQMVGIRNRSFASRVNFGNDSSLPGSVYHLVIVFLDSADEARRFRIAKQFKDLPEGLRRSREFTFVRK